MASERPGGSPCSLAHASTWAIKSSERRIVRVGSLPELVRIARAFRGSYLGPRPQRAHDRNLPIAQIVEARPTMEGFPTLAINVPRMLFGLLFMRRGIDRPTTGAGEMDGALGAVAHPGNMRRELADS
jgi:hypothetical protein